MYKIYIMTCEGYNVMYTDDKIFADYMNKKLRWWQRIYLFFKG